MFDGGKYKCACSFMDSIFVMGGRREDMTTSNSCMKLDTNTLKWSAISNMTMGRKNAACSTFEGRIVVTGGEGGEISAEMYDHIDDTWSMLPNMNHRRTYHTMVDVRDKLFVVGGSSVNNVEVFDSTCYNFTVMKSFPLEWFSYSDVVSIGNKLIKPGIVDQPTLVYVLETEKWTSVFCEVTSKRGNLNVLKYLSCSLIQISR